MSYSADQTKEGLIRMTISNVSRLTALFVAGLLTCTPAAHAQSTGFCSDKTLHGAYGFSVEGMLYASSDHPLLMLRAVAVTTFDGKGGLTQVDHYVVNGTPQTPPANPWPSSAGTYTVNPDCTGTLTLNVPNMPPFVSYFVVVNGGKEIRTVLDANLVSSVGVRIE
jgi:hypothetical protein